MTRPRILLHSHRACIRYGIAIALGVVLYHWPDGLLALDQSDEKSVIPNAEQLYSKLTVLAERLKTVRVFSADRSQERASPVAKPKIQVRWHEFFVDGDRVQLQSCWEYPDSDCPEWWGGWSSSGEPLTAESIDSIFGRISCHRPQGDVTHIEIAPSDPAKKLPYRWLYCAYSTFRPFDSFDLPLIGVRRDWNPPDSPHRGSDLLVDQLLSIDFHRWKDVERDHMLNVPTIKVVIQISDEPVELKLERHDGGLQISSIRTVWFTDDEHNFPIRIEDDRRYVYKGQQIPLVRKDEWRFGPVFTANEYKDFGGGIWYPEVGSQTHYAASPDDSAPSETLDNIVDDFLRDGQYRFKLEMFPTLTREWKVLELEKLPENSELWIEPVEGWMVNNVDSRVAQIVGKSVKETTELLYGRGADGAVQNNGNEDLSKGTSNSAKVKHGSSGVTSSPITNIVLFISMAVLLVLALTAYFFSKR